MLATIMLLATMVATVSAENVNAFPPQRPQVGNMMARMSPLGIIVAGLRTNGTVNVQYSSTGSTTEQKIDRVRSWTDIVQIAVSGLGVFGLKSDGTVVHTLEDYIYGSSWNSDASKKIIADIESWEDIVQIETGSFFKSFSVYGHIVGLKSDGTVVATGDNTSSQCDVGSFRDVSKIYCGDGLTVGITKDGKVLTMGKLSNRNDVRKWENVVQVFDKSDYAMALTNDGKLLRTSYNNPLYNNSEYMNPKVIKMANDFPYFKITGYVLEQDGKFYSIDEDGVEHKEQPTVFKTKLIEEDIIDFDTDGSTYLALAKDGKIYSNKYSLDNSDNWILTTNITINGDRLDSDVPPYVKDGRTLGPLRVILEALGMSVTWDDVAQTATGVKGNVTISVTIGSNVASVNGEDKTLDVAAEITNGRTMVPVRFFAENLNMNVEWDNYTKTVIISD